MTAVATRKKYARSVDCGNRPKDQEMWIQGLHNNMISVSMVEQNSRKIVFATILTSFEAYRRGLRRTSTTLVELQLAQPREKSHILQSCLFFGERDELGC